MSTDKTTAIAEDLTDEFVLDDLPFTRIMGQSVPHEHMEPSGSVDEAIPSARIQFVDGPSRCAGLSQSQYERVLQAATQLFIDSGIHTVRFERVISEAGLNPVEGQALRKHFECPVDLLVEVFQPCRKALISDLSDVVLDDRPFVSRLRTVTRQYVKFGRTYPAQFAAYLQLTGRVQSGQGVPAKVINLVDTFQRNRMRILSAFLAEGQMRGEINEGDPEMLAELVDAALQGVVLRLNSQRLSSVGVYDDDFVDAAVDVLLDGICR